MNETIAIVEYILKLGPIVIGGVLLWGIKSLGTTFFNLIIEVRLLSEKLETLNQTMERIPKLEKDVNEAHIKIRQIVEEH
jgi:hypothetical protein